MKYIFFSLHINNSTADFRIGNVDPIISCFAFVWFFRNQKCKFHLHICYITDKIRDAFILNKWGIDIFGI